MIARIRVSLDEYFFGAQFSGPVQVDRVDGLVRTEGEHLFHAAVKCGVDHISCAHHVGLNGLKRIVFTRRNLFERSSVHDDVHAVEGSLQPFPVAHIADKIADRRAGALRIKTSHFMLLQFISAENDQFLGSILFQRDFGELPPERSRPSSYEYHLIVQAHVVVIPHEKEEAFEWTRRRSILTQPPSARRWKRGLAPTRSENSRP